MSADAVPRTIDYYLTEDGKSPFIEWLEELTPEVRAKIAVRFKRVEQSNFGVHREESGGVWALIYDLGPGYRVYYALTDQHKVVLLLAGGMKRRQNRDIAKAVEYWKDYQTNDAKA
jgi:putative addiction module killer protein